MSEFTPPSDVLRRLGAETERLPNAQMSVGPHEGAFLRFVVALKRPRLALEIGVFTGWSGIEIATALPEGGRLIGLDVNPETTAIARRYAEEAGVADRIEHVLGPALDSLAQLDGPFDLVFIDADKPAYIDYYEAVLPKLAPDGVILADNTLSKSVQPFNEHLVRDDRVEFVLVPLRDGITLIRRRA